MTSFRPELSVRVVGVGGVVVSAKCGKQASEREARQGRNVRNVEVAAS
jgi:hypothetical protein